MLTRLIFFSSICKIFYPLGKQLAIISNRLLGLELLVVVFNFTLQMSYQK
jgi:hypothetical protein